MKRILYLHPKSNAANTAQILRNHGHKLVATCRYVDALEMLRTQSFDAVVIDDEDENPQVLDFTVQAHCWWPELPVFLTIDWGTELPLALESLGRIGQFSEPRLGHEVGVVFDGFPASRQV